MDMVEVNTADLIGPALDYAVAHAEGYELRRNKYQWHLYVEGAKCGSFYPNKKHDFVVRQAGYWQPSVAWSQGGALIDLWITALNQQSADTWMAYCDDSVGVGHTALIAVCRAIVAAEIGETVQVPEELCSPIAA